ncbi:hypothetical protein Efla_006720 [Eimeria flavescens]
MQSASAFLLPRFLTRSLQLPVANATLFLVAPASFKQPGEVTLACKLDFQRPVSSSSTQPTEESDSSDFSSAHATRAASSEKQFVTSNRCAEGLSPVGKLLASRGLCSRGEGDEFFSLGLVLLNGRRLERFEAYLHPDAPLQLAPRAERLMEQKLTILLHKPMHFLTCQTDHKLPDGAGGKPLGKSLLSPENHWGPSDGRAVLDLRKTRKLVAAGRLDAESSGLQVYTQDGRIAALLTGGADEKIAKEYIVQVDVPPSRGALTLLESGLSLDGRALRPAVVKLLDPTAAISMLGGAGVGEAGCPRNAGSSSVSERSVFLSIELREGRNRQIRRMCELVGLRVLRIHRIRIGKIHLESLPPGRWRYLQRGVRFS